MSKLENIQEGLRKKQLNQHFIFNTLNTIKCNTIIDKKQACRLIDDFAKYLRYNFNVLEKKEAVAFREEIEQVKVYLELEMARFSQIKAEYELEEENFFLPPMCLQPLVEAALVYGLCPKEQGGTIVIRSFQEELDYVIEINDNGVGLGTENGEEEKTRLQTIEEIRYCLEELMDGTLQLESEPEKGTWITIRIPVNNARKREFQ